MRLNPRKYLKSKLQIVMKKNWLQLLIFGILIGSVIWTGKGIFKYSIFSTHDGDHHIARSFDAVTTFKEGEFPLRWAGSLNYFCGVPIYNFYYPLLYYLVILGNFLTHNVLYTLKIVYFLSLLLGTVGFYFWAREETGKDISGVIVCAGVMPAYEDELRKQKAIGILVYGWGLQVQQW